MTATEILRGYLLNARIYEILNTEYNQLRKNGDIKAQEYHEKISQGIKAGSPVENYIQRLETLQFMMNELGKLIFPVHRLIDDLSQSLVHGVNKDSLILEFMQCHYWENLTMSETARKIGITYRRCEKLRAELISDMKKYIKDTAQKP